MKRIIKYTFFTLGVLLLVFAANFFIVKKLDQKAIEMVGFVPSDHPSEKPYLVPSQFIDSARFFVKLPLSNHDTILGFCDTGGGLSMLMPAMKSHESIKKEIHKGLLKGLMPFDYILFSDLVSDTRFPKPLPMRNFVLRNPFARIKDPYLIIAPEDQEIKMIEEKMPLMKAFLGQSFFMGKSWTLDYIDQKIWVNTPLQKDLLGTPNVQALGFKKNSHDVSIYGHPSMQMEVEGQTIDVLFDTGATFLLSENGQKLFNTNKKTIAGSFIAESIFDQWKKDHPDWKIYPNSDMSRDIIEVPLVKIGEYEVGPVLFAKRPDKNWSEGMIRSMDKVVKGAIGGSIFQYFKITIDYNAELVKFEQ